jgi:hypothetical protein
MILSQIFLLSVFSVTAVFQFFGLYRYYNRMPDDMLGHLLYIASIIFLLSGIVVIIVQIRKKLK